MFTPMSAPEHVSGDGPPKRSFSATTVHVFCVCKFSELKTMRNSSAISSAKFDAGGSTFHVLCYPNGNTPTSKGFVSLYVQITSLMDDDAAPNVEAQFQFTLLDCAGNPARWYSFPSMICAFDRSRDSWGFEHFVGHRAIETSSSFFDDRLLIQCAVHVTDAGRLIIKTPPSTLHADLGGLLADGVGADVTFEVAGERFAAHKCVLAARSTVFKAEFFGPMCSMEKSETCVRIDDVDPEAFKALLHYVYNDSMPELEHKEMVAMAQHLLVAADRYCLVTLKAFCADILSKNIDRRTALATLVLSDQHGCEELKKACFKCVMGHEDLRGLMAMDNFEHLAQSCPSVLKELMARILDNRPYTTGNSTYADSGSLSAYNE